jgi:hypothetical protein
MGTNVEVTSALKMEAVYSSKMLVPIYQTLSYQCNKPEVYNLVYIARIEVYMEVKNHIVTSMCGDYYKTGIGSTTGFIGSQTVTRNYNVYTL